MKDICRKRQRNCSSFQREEEQQKVRKRKKNNSQKDWWEICNLDRKESERDLGVWLPSKNDTATLSLADRRDVCVCERCPASAVSVITGCQSEQQADPAASRTGFLGQGGEDVCLEIICDLHVCTPALPVFFCFLLKQLHGHCCEGAADGGPTAGTSDLGAANFHWKWKLYSCTEMSCSEKERLWV